MSSGDSAEKKPPRSKKTSRKRAAPSTQESVSAESAWTSLLAESLPSRPEGESSHSVSPSVSFRNLISWISHELKTPLMGVMNPLRYLISEEGLTDQAKSEWISMAIRNAERLDHTLTLFLDLAEDHAGGDAAHGSRLNPVNLQTLIEVLRERFSESRSPVRWIESGGNSISQWASACFVLDLQRFARAVEAWARWMGTREVSLSLPLDRLVFRRTDGEVIPAAILSRLHLAQEAMRAGGLQPGSVLGTLLQNESRFLALREDREVLDEEVYWILQTFEQMGVRIEDSQAAQGRVSLQLQRVSGRTEAEQCLLRSGIPSHECVQVEWDSNAEGSVSERLNRYSAQWGRIRSSDCWIPFDSSSGVLILPGILERDRELLRAELQSEVSLQTQPFTPIVANSPQS